MRLFFVATCVALASAAQNIGPRASTRRARPDVVRAKCPTTVEEIDCRLREFKELEDSILTTDLAWIAAVIQGYNAGVARIRLCISPDVTSHKVNAANWAVVSAAHASNETGTTKLTTIFKSVDRLEEILVDIDDSTINQIQTALLSQVMGDSNIDRIVTSLKNKRNDVVAANVPSVEEKQRKRERANLLYNAANYFFKVIDTTLSDLEVDIQAGASIAENDNVFAILNNSIEFLQLCYRSLAHAEIDIMNASFETAKSIAYLTALRSLLANASVPDAANIK